MSKTTGITYGVSIMMGEHWQKLDVNQVPTTKKDTMESMLDEVSDRVSAWHKKKYPQMYPEDKKYLWPITVDHNEIYGGQDMPFSIEDSEWSAVKQRLEEIEFMEDAQEFIDTTSYKLTLEAKKIINSKKSKL